MDADDKICDGCELPGSTCQCNYCKSCDQKLVDCMCEEE